MVYANVDIKYIVCNKNAVSFPAEWNGREVAIVPVMTPTQHPILGEQKKNQSGKG